MGANRLCKSNFLFGVVKIIYRQFKLFELHWFSEFLSNWINEAKILMFAFLDKIQQVADKKGLKRKDLAKLIGTSPSYITQLFRGDKLINFTTLARFNKALGVEFNISIVE